MQISSEIFNVSFWRSIQLSPSALPVIATERMPGQYGAGVIHLAANSNPRLFRLLLLVELL